MTFTIPAPAQDPVGQQVLATFPDAATQKIPMRCRFDTATNTWECDVLTFWERSSTWWMLGAALGGLTIGFTLGRIGRRK